MKGRFAPSPTGRMHLGNIVTALASWLSARTQGGGWILRIEDLDPQRSRRVHSELIEDDLRWLGLEWDEGGLDDRGTAGPYSQSRRGDFYTEALSRLVATGRVYPCTCTRADIMATQAPHQSDGRIIYPGTCRKNLPPDSPLLHGRPKIPDTDAPWSIPTSSSLRIVVPDREITFTDGTYGPQRVNLATHCGDFILRRADGAWAYQLAVVVDDALMGVTEIMRGSDLLLSSAQQIYLYELLGHRPPRFAHVPLICNAEGRRLSKRDSSLSMAELRRTHTPAQLLGRCAHILGLTPTPAPISLTELLAIPFSLPSVKTIQLPF